MTEVSPTFGKEGGLGPNIGGKKWIEEVILSFFKRDHSLFAIFLKN